MRARAAAIVCLSVLAAHGCLLFTDIGGLDTEDVALDDASTSETTSPFDAPVDVATGDASQPDSPSILDGAAGCANSDAAFCVDFDDGVLAGKWTSLEPDGAGRTLAISSAVSKSPSMSLHSALDRAKIVHGEGDCSYARATRDLSNLGAKSRARFSFDAWRGAPTGPADPSFLLVAQLITNKGCNFIVSLEDESCGVIFQFPREGGVAEDNVSGSLDSPIGKAWAHVDLDVSFAPFAPTWSVSVNGRRCGAEKVMPEECRGAQTIEISPGMYCVGKGTGVAEVYIDNVEVR